MTTSNPPEALSAAPARPGGWSFRVTQLVFSERRVVVRTSASGWMFALLLVGASSAAFWFVPGFVRGEPTLAGRIIGAALVLLGVLMGGFVVFHKRRVTFDLEAGEVRSRGKVIPLGDVLGIQVLAEDVADDENTMTSYELNLVFGPELERINVLDHGSERSIMADATALADRLGVAVWRMDATQAQA